jgi:hypothetical protein
MPFWNFVKTPGGGGGFSNTHSLLFDGVNEYVTFGVGPMALESNLPWTLSMWIKPSSLPNCGIWGNMAGSTTFRGVYYGIIVGKLYLQMVNDNGTGAYFDVRTTSAGPTIGAWNHVVLVYRGTRLGSGVDHYLNNSLATVSIPTNALGTGTILPATDMRIGSDRFGGEFPGNINQVSFWDVAMNSTQVSELYNSGEPADLSSHSLAANLVNWCPFGTGDTHPTAIDVEGGQNGTMTNMESGDIVADVP